MTTSILPTKSQLQAYTVTPSQLKRDAEVESFLQGHYDFLILLNKTLRSGYLSFDYYTTQPVAAKFYEYLTSTDYGYNYSVTAPALESSGTYVGKWKFTVSWA